MQSSEESRYNLDVVELLLRAGLVILPQYDMYLSSLMENGLNQMGITFTTQLMQRLLSQPDPEKQQSGPPQQVYTEVRLHILFVLKTNVILK